MIKEVVFTNNFAVRYAHLFIASRPKYPEQLEMPAPILSLSGTAVILLMCLISVADQTVRYSLGSRNIKTTEPAKC
jgi:hypothetical protein